MLVLSMFQYLYVQNIGKEYTTMFMHQMSYNRRHVAIATNQQE